jgi:hypothetical protein
MAATLTTMQDAMKRLYLPRLRSTVNTATVLSTRLEKNTEMTSVSGRNAIVPINIRPSEAIGARPDDGTLPTAQNQTFVECAIPYAFNYATIRITHPTIASTKNDAGAWAKVVSAEMEGIQRDLKNDFNRQYFGNGTGSLGTVASVSGQVITMDAGHSLKINMVLDIYNSALDTQDATDITVTAVSGNAVTVTGTLTGVGDGDVVVRTGSLNQEMMGLVGIIDDGSEVATLQGISRSSYPEWKSTVVDAGGALTATTLDDAILEIEATGEAALTCGITDRTQFRKIANLMIADRRYTDTMELKGGFKAITWGDIPIFWDRDTPLDGQNAGKSQLFFLDENEIQRYELQDLDFDDTDGNVLHRVANKASYDATLFYYGNLGCTAPDNQGVIRNIT